MAIVIIRIIAAGLLFACAGLGLQAQDTHFYGDGPYITYLPDGKARVVTVDAGGRISDTVTEAPKPGYISIRSLLRTGDMVNVDFAYDRLPNELDPFDNEAFNRSGIDFYATVTNVETGEAEYMRIGDCTADMDIIRASDRVVIVLTHPRDYVRTGSMLAMGRLWYRKERKLLEAFAQRNERYNSCLQRILQMEKEGSALVIAPEKGLEISRLETDPHKVRTVHGIGVKDALESWERLVAYLGR